MHVAAFIGKLQHYKNFKPSYLSIGKWAISPFLSDQVTYVKFTDSMCMWFNGSLIQLLRLSEVYYGFVKLGFCK